MHANLFTTKKNCILRNSFLNKVTVRILECWWSKDPNSKSTLMNYVRRQLNKKGLCLVGTAEISRILKRWNEYNTAMKLSNPPFFGIRTCRRYTAVRKAEKKNVSLFIQYIQGNAMTTRLIWPLRTDVYGMI